jgi:HSP20 family protein
LKSKNKSGLLRGQRQRPEILNDKIKKEGSIMFLRRPFYYPAWDLKNPFNELDRMRREMDNLFGEFQQGPYRVLGAGVFPMLNLTEDKDNYYARAELPGLKSDEIDISVTGKSLSISGERKIPSEGENVRYHRKEREAGRFSRMITLPGDVDVDKVDANHSGGILTVVIPKAEAAKPKQITVSQ